jgi:hypothetical protein
MATFKGKAVFWGAGGLTFAGFASGATFEAQSFNFTKTADEKLIRDYEGETVAAVYYNPTREISFEVVPSATSIALVKTAADALLPDAGTVITLTDADSTETDEAQFSTGAGKYLVRSAALSRSNESEARISVTAFMSDGGNDITTTVS